MRIVLLVTLIAISPVSAQPKKPEVQSSTPWTLQRLRNFGLQLQEPSPILAHQLDLPKGQGLVVVGVAEDSNAEQAGLKVHDVLLEIGKQSVPGTLPAFLRSLQLLKDEEPQDWQVIRRGRFVTLKNVKLPSLTKRAEALVRQFSHDESNKREEASQQIVELGEAALPVLRQTLKRLAKEREIIRRSEAALKAILSKLQNQSSFGMKMSFIAKGSFNMGSPANESGRRADELQHRIEISEPFLLGKFEVTQTQFLTLMKHNPSGFWNLGKGKKREDHRRYPVENVTWFDAVEFCNRLSKAEGYAPYYKLTDLKREDESIVDAKVVIQGGNGYRLPTEAEWELACRAGTTTPFHFGSRNTGKQSNVKAPFRTRGSYGGRYKAWKDLSRTTNIGSYPANQWELHEMLGNVAEWVQDFYSPTYYRTSPKKDPTGPEKGRHRVIRGGSWLVTENDARSASRFYQTPDERKNYVGFRVARTP